MPVTLAQASLNAASDIDRNVIDEFRKSSFLLDALPFDQSVNPAGGGSTLVYGYTRQTTQRAAAFRAINAEYTPAEVQKAQYTVNLRPLGGIVRDRPRAHRHRRDQRGRVPADPAHQGDQGLLRRPGHQRQRRRDDRRLRWAEPGAHRLLHRGGGAAARPHRRQQPATALASGPADQRLARPRWTAGPTRCS